MPAITGIFGLMGKGKTMLATKYAVTDAILKNKVVYSNYHLKNIDYQPIKTLEDIQKMKNCLAIFDELWLWLFARTSQSNLNKEIMKIIFLNRKRNVEIIYTAQLNRTIDVLLREATQYYIYPFIHKTPENKYHIAYFIFDRLGKSLTGLEPTILKHDLEYWGKYYDTTEEISQLGTKKNLLQQGITQEIHFCKALKKAKQIKDFYLIPNSGKYSPWRFDVLATTIKNKTIAIDVKSSSKTRVTMDTRHLFEQIKNAEKWNFIPYIAFPMNDKIRLTDPKHWYMYHLTRHSYVCKLKQPPDYNKFVKNSDKLLDF